MSEQKNQKTRKWWLGLLGLLLLLEERPFWLNGLLLLKGLLFLLFAVFMRTPDPKIITAESGQDVTLTCRAPNNNNISVKWSRADLGDEYVLLYQDEQFDPANQHPSFKNRVDLQDRQMKDGDVSLILKDVTINDTGRYECRVFIEETRSWKLIIIIHLHVDPPVKRFRRRRILRVAVKRFRRRRILRVADQKNITAESGQNVTLTCRAPNNNINIVEWSRADLGDEYVLLYRDEQFVPDDQHPSFKNRVDLQDRQMKDGDVSLILKDVTINDTGTYECGVVQTGTEHLEFINTTNLHVDPPGHTGGHKDGGKENKGKEDASVGLSVLLLLLLLIAVVGFLIYKLRQQQSEKTNQPPVEVLQAEYGSGTDTGPFSICVSLPDPYRNRRCIWDSCRRVAVT